MILESPFPKILIPNVSYSDYALQELAKHGNRIALIDEENPQKVFTFNQIRELSIKYAVVFQKYGIGKGDFISTCFSNCLEMPSIIIAAAYCGAVITTCNPHYTEDEITKQLENATPKMMIVDDQSYSKMKSVARFFPSIQFIMTIEKSLLCDSLQEEIKACNGFPKPVPIDPANDVLVLLHSSGTTGLPKAVTLTHRNWIAYGETVKLAFPHSTNDCDYISEPMFHIFGLLCSICYLIQGSKIVIGKRFQAENFLSLVEKFKISHFSAVPAMILSIYNSPQLSRFDLSSLKNIMCGSAPLPTGIALDVQNKLKARIYQGYGMTEGLMASSSMYSTIPIDSVGVPFPNTQIKIVDVHDGKAVGPNKLGELCSKNPLVMKGYYKNPDATSQCIDSDGWLHSGDIGYFDDFGYLFIVDRMKELIKYKGFQVAPAELEQTLLQHPHIKDAAVVGIPHLQAGELPKAFIVRNNYTLTSDDVHRFMEEKLAKYKQLKGGIEFCDHIPRNDTGKILRRELKTKYLKSKL